MELELEFEKSLEENASSYFEKSKKAKRKLAGLRKAIIPMQEKLRKHETKPLVQKLEKKRKLQWFQAFHWFRSSSGLLVIGGRDAKSNETIVKRHLEKDDLFFHADIQGAASVAVKAEGKEIPEKTIREAAEFAAVRSKAWQQSLVSVDVYAVSKDQVSKKAPSGEALGTGAFMIYGKRQWFRKTPLRFAVGLVENGFDFLAMGGPPEAVEKNSLVSFELVHGKQKRSDIAKALLSRFEAKLGKKRPVSLEEIVSVLPGDLLSIRERF